MLNKILYIIEKQIPGSDSCVGSEVHNMYGPSDASSNTVD